MIRKANLKDLEVIIKYNQQLALETEGVKLDQEKLFKGVISLLADDTKGSYYLYETGGKVVGQLLVTYEWSDWRNANYWWIQSVYVNPDYRRQGIFKQLYEHVKLLAEMEDTVCGLRLYVEQQNFNAQTTYQKLNMYPSKYLMYEWNKA
ncbi:MAG: GNAT family N-acetyltransferase [Bacilli bacterium]|nr:GNAT family N-acetyltransferase [Bacilli bacterium]MDD4077478.1 GNAT family N-acetyltransferase [Bacilli bacterium]